MLNIAGNIVSRTTATVSGTVSSAASAASGTLKRGFQIGRDRRQSENGTMEDYVIANARDKATINLKGTPGKDAVTTSYLAVKKGYLMKKNEQGSWHKRLVCMVPHMFLYYFDNDASTDPRGIVDLHYYTDVEVEGPEHNILKLIPQDGTELKAFFFEIENHDELSEWMNALHQDRYNVIKDQRDAYQHLQIQFSGEINSTKKQAEETAIDKSRMELRVVEANKTAVEATDVLKRVLARTGIPEEDMLKLEDVNAIGEALVQNVSDLQERFDVMVDENAKTRLQDKAEFEQRLRTLETQLEDEKLTRKSLEATLTQERKDAEMKVRELRAEIDKANLNMQMAIATKTLAEEKTSTLHAQKKVLVKEVKSQRTKLEQSTESLSTLKSLNDRLTTAVGVLQDQHRVMAAKLEAAQAAGPSNVESGEELPLDDSTSISDSVSGDMDAVTDALLRDLRASEISLSTSSEDNNAKSMRGGKIKSNKSKNRSKATAEWGVLGTGSPARDGDGHVEDEEIDDVDADEEDDDEDSDADGTDKDEGDAAASDERVRKQKKRMSWEMPALALKELSWLTAEQRHVVEGRLSSGSETGSISRTGSEDGGTGSVTSSEAHASESNTTSSSLSAAAFSLSVSPSSLFATMASTVSSSSGSNSVSSSSAAAVGTGTGSQAATLGSPSKVAPPSTSSSSSFSSFGSMFGSKDKVNSTPALLSEDLLDPSERPPSVTPITTSSSTPRSSVGADSTASAGTGASSPGSPHSPKTTVNSFSDSPLAAADAPPPTTAQNKIHCLRCSGTVEGPKYSTCKCLMPALTPDDLAQPAATSGAATAAGSASDSGSSRTSRVFGLFSRAASSAASSAAGIAGAAGGIVSSSLTSSEH